MIRRIVALDEQPREKRGEREKIRGCHAGRAHAVRQRAHSRFSLRYERRRGARNESRKRCASNFTGICKISRGRTRVSAAIKRSKVYAQGGHPQTRGTRRRSSFSRYRSCFVLQLFLLLSLRSTKMSLVKRVPAYETRVPCNVTPRASDSPLTAGVKLIRIVRITTTSRSQSKDEFQRVARAG